MLRCNRRHRLLIGAAVSILALVPISSSAEVPVAAAATKTATCTARVQTTPVTYSPVISTSPPGVSTRGTFTVTVNSACSGSGYAYQDTQINIFYLIEGIFLVHYAGVDCGAVTSCSYTFSFTGGPYSFDVQGTAFWDSTNGQPWQVKSPDAWPADYGCYTWTGLDSRMVCDVSDTLVV